ncbi:hypothetical protein PENCOP_c004G04423 [Penicillium coprophilum]|uniref:DUF4246 domain-containing protein n=1 Tax=Penicillium coprophilum TaxID=36646 RepID=A0A1V6UUC6_9EURO|nr:hypothetical protein PENCOP_c004G04423 [Penicillium coprophilum]
MSENAWESCVKELRDQAANLCENRQIHIRVLDTGSFVCKADTEILDSLSAVLRGGQVDLDNVLGFYRNARVASKPYDRRTNPKSFQKEIDRVGFPCWGIGLPHGEESEFYHRISNYQCLPSEMEFLHDFGTEVQITSYTNNLHPAHRDLYQTIEKPISMTLKLWNDCLVKRQSGWNDHFNQGYLGPVPLRIITYGAEWENEHPEWPLAPRVTIEARKLICHKAQEALQSSKGDQTKKSRKEYLDAQRRLSGLRGAADSLDKKLSLPDSDL